MDTLDSYAYWMVVGAYWLFLLAGAWLLIITLLIWLKLARQNSDWHLTWQQALKDLTLPASGFAAAIMVLGREPSERWIVYLGALMFFLVANLASRYMRRKELSVWRLVHRKS